jgi:HPt (histidine-containing phosphotransfer) domain-containing protein
MAARQRLLIRTDSYIQVSRDARKLIDDIEAALIRKDCGQFRELAHALKGAAMMTGVGCEI